MVTALVRKELRESVAVVAVALLLAAYYFGGLVGLPLLPWMYARSIQSIPFVNDGVLTAIALVGGGLAVGLGLKQTAWEAHAETYYFLLHRPIDRTRVFALKVVVGVALTLVLTGSLVLGYAVWAATPGAHDAPFRWSMIGPAVQALLVLPLVYFGAFASGVRPAVWFGTKLAPLVVALLASLGIAAIPWWGLALGCGLVVGALLLVTAFHDIVTRDF